MKITVAIAFVLTLSICGHSESTNGLPDMDYRRFFEFFVQHPAEERGVTNIYAELRQELSAKGFTNVTELDLRRDPSIYVTNMFRIHATLPANCLDWPPPDTNKMDGVKRFISEHGWNMPERSARDMMVGRGTKPITGLPWPAIYDRTFDAYTSERWLWVILHGPTSFGPEHDGLLWSLQTNRPPFPGVTCRPLGSGWYAFVYPKRDSVEKP
ncbi:MAG TPA: hypothetical protein VN887_03350 [Candidatus Angelobacter sp.]|nr:hypothetical protein [Candidatus Angelobacter sp.]